MADVLPDEAETLLSEESVMAHLATCSDGRPHVAPVWYHYGDGTVSILTGGRKLANIRENPRVAVSFQKDTAGKQNGWLRYGERPPWSRTRRKHSKPPRR